MDRRLIRNGRVIDPASGLDAVRDILIEEGTIAAIGESIVAGDAEIIEAEGLVVAPGFVDMHVHLREPGREDVETIIGGSHVAAKGGFTAVCAMPNTNPVIDNQALVRFIIMEAAKGPINVYPVATVTKGAESKEISEMGELIRAGAVAFSDDGWPVRSSIIMRRALEYARMFDVPVLSHAEDLELTDDGIMNEGKNSILLGMKGIPAASEDVMVARDVMLAELTKGRVHICHVSTKGSVEIIRLAKARGVRVTAEATPHHFTLTDEAVKQHQALAKMKPPLREEEDRRAVIEGLRDGTIDAIATDHAPHSSHEKKQEMAYAPFGIIGLETALPLAISELVEKEGFELPHVIRLMTSNPAKLLNLPHGELKAGATADITLFDPEADVYIDKDFIVSRARNTPFMGATLKGRIHMTICNGQTVYKAQ